MNRVFKHAAVATIVLGIAGVMAGGCLDRPVVHADPNLNTTFITKIQYESIDKVDLLFMIDNSASMGDKQTLLALAMPLMIQRLVTPNCVDSTGSPNGMTVDASGNCATGKPEFPPVHDLHLGVVSSSLGGRGGDQCPDDAPNPVAPNLSAHTNDRGELINRGGVAGNPTVENPMPDETSPDNFLAYFPGCASGAGTPCTTGLNSGKTVPANAITSSMNLIADFQTALEGVHEHGCGFEAQNEAWYRFLVQPDPFQKITLGNGGQATLSGIDETILEQRADFLRPDSLLAVIVVTDENEEAADPLAMGGLGWAFDSSTFGNGLYQTAPEGTIECSKLDPNNPSTTGPNDPNCTSCAYNNVMSAPNFAQRCPNGGFFTQGDDAINVRFFHQQQRFGLSSAYPTSRYVMGLQKTAVPSVGLAFQGDTDNEHDGSGKYVGDQPGHQNCVNPIFAENLPTKETQDLCHLKAGPRTPDLVYYAAIAGVPHQLLQATPGEADQYGTCKSGTAAADCPQKDVLSDADWKLITGNDPEHYDFAGADFHMIESEQDRIKATTSDPSAPAWANQSSCAASTQDPATPAAGSGFPQGYCDPINGREWATNKADLEFSCIFPLVHVDATNTIQFFNKDCTCTSGSGPGCVYSGACDCGLNQINSNTQLCRSDGNGNHTQVQVNGKAYPSVREMLIAKAMSKSTSGNQGIVSSICPIHLAQDVGMSLQAAAKDPLFGYNPAVDAIVNRLKKSLGNTCVPEKLTVQPAREPNGQPNPSAGLAPCLIMVQMPPDTVGKGTCKSPGSVCNAQGLLGPGVIPPGGKYTTPPLTQDILDKFCDGLEQQYLSVQGNAPNGPGDPTNVPVCAMEQLVLDANDTTDCSTAPTPGWCYVQGAAAQSKGCPYTIVFAGNMPPNGSVVSLQCLETGNGSVVGDAGGGG